MKDTFYFPHDQNAHSDPKIMSILMRVGLSGIGLYWILIEILHEQEDGYITYDQFRDYVNWYCSREKDCSTLVEQMLNIFFDLLLLVRTDDDLVTSNRVIKNKSFRDDLSKKRSEAGKKSALLRQQSTSVEQKESFVEQGKEIKGKEIKEKESIERKKDTEKSETIKIPPEFSTTLSDTFLLFLEYRKQRKIKPYTSIGLSQAFELINKFRKDHGEQCVIDALKEAMANNYQGFFPEKHIPKTPPPQHTKQPSPSQLEAIKRHNEQEKSEERKHIHELDNLWKQYSNLDFDEQQEIEFLAEERCNAISVPRGKIGFEQVMKGFIMKIFREKKGL